MVNQFDLGLEFVKQPAMLCMDSIPGRRRGSDPLLSLPMRVFWPSKLRRRGFLPAGRVMLLDTMRSPGPVFFRSCGLRFKSLEPCPWCGGPARLQEDRFLCWIDGTSWRIVCGACKASRGSGWRETKEDAIAAWTFASQAGSRPASRHTTWGS